MNCFDLFQSMIQFMNPASCSYPMSLDATTSIPVSSAFASTHYPSFVRPCLCVSDGMVYCPRKIFLHWVSMYNCQTMRQIWKSIFYALCTIFSIAALVFLFLTPIESNRGKIFDYRLLTIMVAVVISLLVLFFFAACLAYLFQWEWLVRFLAKVEKKCDLDGEGFFRFQTGLMICCYLFLNSF